MPEERIVLLGHISLADFGRVLRYFPTQRLLILRSDLNNAYYYATNSLLIK